MWLPDSMVMWFYGWSPFTHNLYPIKLGHHDPCGIGDFTLYVFHVTSHDCVVRGSWGYMGGFVSP